VRKQVNGRMKHSEVKEKWKIYFLRLNKDIRILQADKGNCTAG
jgi:hypothetical protein